MITKRKLAIEIIFDAMRRRGLSAKLSQIKAMVLCYETTREFHLAAEIARRVKAADEIQDTIEL